MGTFHAFVSEPIPSKEDAAILLAKVCNLLSDSKYLNEAKNCTMIEVRNFYIIVGVIKNLGYEASELNEIDTDINMVAVSDERDFTFIENRPEKTPS